MEKEKKKTRSEKIKILVRSAIFPNALNIFGLNKKETNKQTKS